MARPFFGQHYFSRLYQANLNEKTQVLLDTSPINSQTTPGRKISSIFKPKSKQDDDDENLGSNLSFSKKIKII